MYSKTTTMADEKEEVTLILFDNSSYMRSGVSLVAHRNQIEAIDLYCHAKLESNPKNAIGVYTMSGVCSYLEPTSDVDKIIAHLHTGITYRGDLQLIRGLSLSLSHINELAFKHKRLLLSVGGPSVFPHSSAKAAGDVVTRFGVAVDVFNFCLKNEYFKSCLDLFVHGAPGNSHIKHIHPASSLAVIRDALSSSPPIVTLASIQQRYIALAKIAREREDKENHPIWKGKRNRLNLKDNPAPPPPKVPRLKSVLVSGGNQYYTSVKGESVVIVSRGI